MPPYISKSYDVSALTVLLRNYSLTSYQHGHSVGIRLTATLLCVALVTISQSHHRTGCRQMKILQMAELEQYYINNNS